MNPRPVWPSWKHIEAAARAGISYRAWGRLKSDGRTAEARWYAALEDAYGQALTDLDKCPETHPALASSAGGSRGADANRSGPRPATYEEAVVFYRAMLERLRASPKDHDDAVMLAAARANINLWLGHALRIMGSSDAAVEAYRAAAAACPGFGDAYWGLANLKTYRFTDTELSAIRKALARRKTAPADRVPLCFALGKALEDRADYAGAWQYYAQANALRRAAVDYCPDVVDAKAAALIRACSAGFFEARRNWGHPAPDPIFVLGVPRSGSTLVEQVLASHSAVDGTRELLAIGRLASTLQGSNPDRSDAHDLAMLEQLTPGDCAELGRRYLAMTQVHRRARRFFIDKMPNNVFHIGLIALILPNARIIDTRREPLACCVSNLKQLFATGQEFSYSVGDVARYYRTYLTMMRHWDDVLPGKILRVCHEDLVEDFEAQVRRILAYCELPFETACLAFHETRRPVHTPSSEQVRRPLNRDGLDQWRNFEFALGPLKTALGEALTDWRS